MNKLISKASTIALLSFLSTFAIANVEITADDAEELNEAAEVQQDSYELVSKAIEDYFSSREIIEGEVRKGGKVYYSSKQVVSVGPESPSWSKARQLAFEKALLEARTNFVFDTLGRTVTESQQSTFQDDSSNNREFKDDKNGVGRISAMFDKALALGEAKLDALLQDAGVDPDEYASIPPIERKNLYINSYLTNTISKAFGDASGLLPVQTFEGQDESGTTVIGVVLLYSPKLKQLASDIANGRPPILEQPKGKPLSSYLDYSEDILASQFGVRVVFTEDGKPNVLSFGQWGYSYQGDDNRTKIRNRSVAEETADTKAKEGLVNFINSTVALSDRRTTGESIENFIEKQGNNITERDITNIIDRSSREVSTKASALLAGTRVVKTWKFKAENGQEIVGRVRNWSQKGVDSANDIKNFKAETAREDKSEKPSSQGSNYIRSGAQMGDPEETF